MSDALHETMIDVLESARTCGLGDECETVLDEWVRLRARVEELERVLSSFVADGRDDPGEGNFISITDEMIDKAWAFATGPVFRSPQAIHALGLLGIVACEKCGGSGVEKDDDGNDVGYLVNPAKPYPCPSCHGRGWVRRNDEWHPKVHAHTRLCDSK